MPRRHISIIACPYCGSREVEPKMLFGGPMATVDNDDNTYRCHECGRTAVPLMFSSAEEWIYFRQSRIADKSEAKKVEEGFLTIPILPVDTRPLLSVGGIDVPILKAVEVVGLKWDGNSVERSEYHVSFDRYWRAVSGVRYNASEVMLIDLSGVRDGKPNFRVLRELVKKKYEIWLDLGIRAEADLFDAFTVEVNRALADTSICTSPSVLRQLFELSDRCVPCIQVFDGKVLWASKGRGPSSIPETLELVKEIGFEEAAVVDMQRLGCRCGVSETLLTIDSDLRVFLGGGVLETDAAKIEAAGFSGALIDPFTPIITDLVEQSSEDKVIADAPMSAPKAKKARSPLATD